MHSMNPADMGRRSWRSNKRRWNVKPAAPEMEELLQIVLAKYGTRARAAEAWGVGPSFVSMVFRGTRRPPDYILAESRKT